STGTRQFVPGCTSLPLEPEPTFAAVRQILCSRRTRTTFLTDVGEHEQNSRGLQCLRPPRFVRLAPGPLRVVRPRECSLKTIRASAGLRHHPAGERFEPAGLVRAHA